jgi:hypothetical protein
MERPLWFQPPLLEPETLRYQVLHARLDLYYDGPANHVEAWQTISENTGGWILCQGGFSTTLRDDPVWWSGQLLDELHRETMRRLDAF